MDQDGPILVSNGHNFVRLQIIIVSDDRSHYYDQLGPKIVPIGQQIIWFRSVQNLKDIDVDRYRKI